ncbi:2-succinyl-6-hydroxy-2,4-cyclohexadiene-1-carboxylate synthase [Calidithermus terrae]|uniref:2-succinyl-6-hydroxy-2, 4-cyclohexadiene-1-carboxylate synthase n=1 Tax=Calidithermus terrae TaxID=1408545 RepID=A0A399EYL4_9DEIN|nr:alpha/beta fold hydrolase [Calidithermus terrae]RIH87632.1 2-succinyl-6-hydroxy-2,4-cyclohexadiene-1-carboxylate synthase [Calidithermus terrae]
MPDAVTADLTIPQAVDLFLTPARRGEATYPEAFTRATVLRVPYQQRVFLRPEGEAVEVQVYAWGPAGAPAVLLVHGWESHAGRMGGFVEPLLRQGYRVLAFDAPAHGRSGGRQASMADFAGAVEALSSYFPPVVGLIGHSLGGGAALWHLAHAGAALHKVAALGSPARVTDPVRGFARALGFSPEATAELLAAFHERFGRPMESFSLDRLRFPERVGVLLVHDRGDDVVPYAHAEALRGAIPAARLYPTTGLGHRAILKDESVIAQVARFMGGP